MLRFTIKPSLPDALCVSCSLPQNLMIPHLQLDPPKAVLIELSRGRGAFMVPAPTRGRIEQCRALEPEDLTSEELTALDRRRSAVLGILTEGSARLREDGTTDEAEPLRLGELSSLEEIQLLAGLEAQWSGKDGQMAASFQRILGTAFALRALEAMAESGGDAGAAETQPEAAGA